MEIGQLPSESGEDKQPYWGLPATKYRMPSVDCKLIGFAPAVVALASTARCSVAAQCHCSVPGFRRIILVLPRPRGGLSCSNVPSERARPVAAGFDQFVWTVGEAL